MGYSLHISPGKSSHRNRRRLWASYGFAGCSFWIWIDGCSSWFTHCIKRTEQLNKGLSLTSEKFQWKLPDWMNATQGETQAQSRARQQEETDDYRDEFHRALHQPRRGRRL